ncbi:MAG TPA: HEPN domain-containing protein [Candidatus Norongarragalinales archaeon]|nr:HEPN domain-containing protein [Candidatus Norongarragalinales archaeon]
MREEAKLWLEQAAEDLDSAAANLQIRKYYVCAFFCQQAVEKALKALAIEKIREQPKLTAYLISR